VFVLAIEKLKMQRFFNKMSCHDIVVT